MVCWVLWGLLLLLGGGAGREGLQGTALCGGRGLRCGMHGGEHLQVFVVLDLSSIARLNLSLGGLLLCGLCDQFCNQGVLCARKAVVIRPVCAGAWCSAVATWLTSHGCRSAMVFPRQMAEASQCQSNTESTLFGSTAGSAIRSVQPVMRERDWVQSHSSASHQGCTTRALELHTHLHPQNSYLHCLM